MDTSAKGSWDFQMNRPDQPRSKGPGTALGEGDRAADEGETHLSNDALIDLSEEKEKTKIEAILASLDEELVGLGPVKTKLAEISSLLLVDRMRKRFSLVSSRPNLHMSFTGSPGTGKTTVAMRMAQLLFSLGYLKKGHLVAVTRDDLVGQYIGHTAPKTKEVLKRAMGGVLFIDEAYYLYRPENERDYGQETIEILLQVMENQRDDLVVIVAGYKDRMDKFFESNPGMNSRIAHHVDFPDYSIEELDQIARLILKDQSYYFSKDAEEAFGEYLKKRMAQPHFANARSVRNAIERSRLRQANRIVNSQSEKISKDDLMKITAEDIRLSRVFSDL